MVTLVLSKNSMLKTWVCSCRLTLPMALTFWSNISIVQMFGQFIWIFQVKTTAYIWLRTRAVWPDVGIKSCPNLSKSCQIFVKTNFSKIWLRKNDTLKWNHFSKKNIYPRYFSKKPNLVTLYETHKCWAFKTTHV